MNIGNQILNIRKENQLTQEEFGKLFHVTRQTVSNLENEKSYRSIEELKASILRFVEQYNVMAKPFKWTYKGVSLTV